jgi:hypothetical protein
MAASATPEADKRVERTVTWSSLKWEALYHFPTRVRVIAARWITYAPQSVR